MILKKVGQKIYPEFIEEDFISALETYLNRSKFADRHIEISRISQGRERELGYDGVMTTITPFYLQFKRSYFYTPSSKGKIINDRKKMKVSTNKGVFSFSLHLDRHTNKFEQHNILFELSKNYKTAYCAPLFFKKHDLTEFKKIENHYPYYYEDLTIREYEHTTRFYNQKRIRLFENTMTFSPHKLIIDNETSHQYSFDKQKEICFHSEPEIVESNGNNSTLLQFIDGIIENTETIKVEQLRKDIVKKIPELFRTTYNSQKLKKIIINVLTEISSVEIKTNTSSKKIVGNLSDFGVLILFEVLLEKYFGIRQYIRIE